MLQGLFEVGGWGQGFRKGEVRWDEGDNQVVGSEGCADTLSFVFEV